MIYLDNNATTRIDNEVVEAMQPFITEYYGNPSSNYLLGQRSKEAIENARMQVSKLIGAHPEEIIFTSGGSEANNQILRTVYDMCDKPDKHIITSVIEHPAIINPCRYLETMGVKVTYLQVDSKGLVSPDDIRKSITTDTILITVMHANNEIGTVEPISEIGEIAREHNILFATDAAQSVGKLNINVDELNVDYLSIAGHKFHAPKGIGALYRRKKAVLQPLIHGAGQEMGFRAGTENVIFSVALGKACEIALNNMDEYIPRVKALRDKLLTALMKEIPFVKRNGHDVHCLPNTLNLSFEGINARSLLSELPEVAISTGAACSDKDISLSHTLKSIGISEEAGIGTVRISLSKYTTTEEVEMVSGMIINAIRKIKA